MQVHVFDRAGDAAAAVAERVQQAIVRKPAVVLGLPAGHTPLSIYSELKRRCAAGLIDFSRVTTFNLDEFLGLAAIHPGSFHGFMQTHLFDGVNLEPRRIQFLDGTTSDPVGECARYEAAINIAGGIDVQLLGIGLNGHIGFNEPGEAVIARTHLATLLPATRLANASLFGDDADVVPAFALTMGIGTILSAREILLVAYGESKAEAVEQAVRGGVTTRVPASFLQLHPRVELFLDRRAASRLT